MTTTPTIPAADFVAAAQQANPLSGHIATRQAAGGILGFFGLLPNPDPVLRKMGKSIQVYRDLMPDPSVMSARARRTGAVLAMEHGFDEELSKRTPARVLKACEQLVASLRIRQLVEDGVDASFYGYSVSEVMWKPGPALHQLLAKPPEWFAFDAEDNRLKFLKMGQANGVDVPARKFTVVGKRRNWFNPYGEPDLAAVFWAVVFKRGGLKFWMRFMEKYGTPKAVGKVPRGTNQTEIDALAAKLDAMVEDAIAVIPDDSSAELLSPPAGTDTQIYDRAMNFLKGEINIALLGNNQSTESAANLASAKAAQRVEDHVREADAAICADQVNQVVEFFCEVSFPGAPPPVYGFWEQEEVDEVQAGRDQKLSQAGARLSNQYYQRVYNLQDGDLLPEQSPVGGNDSQAGAGADTASFAEPGADQVPADQVALDAAIDQLPTPAIQKAMATLLKPALDAIAAASTPDQVRQALEDAWPEMDTAELEQLLANAFFVADLVGRDAVVSEAQ